MAQYDGGGIYCPSSSPTITNCTISRNSAGVGGGGICGIFSTVTSSSVKNTILWGDVPDEISLWWGSITVTYSDVDQDGYAGSNGNIRQDPLFVDPVNGDFRLQPTSPCIDSGTSDGAPLTDMAGNPRYDAPWIPNTGGGIYPYYDIGALEYVDTEPPTGSILINGGAEYTTSTSVTLTLSCTDGESGCYQMRFSNDNATWSDWEAYADTKAWTLTSGKGTKTVYVQYMDSAGNVSESFFDTIELLPVVSVDLVPDSTTIPRGGTLGFKAYVKNNTASSQTFKFWTYVKLPNGQRYPVGKELFGPVTVTLPAGKAKSAHLTQKIPTTAPLGTYTYYGNVGSYPTVWDSDSFQFTVTVAASPPAATEDWEVLEDELNK